MIWSNDYLLKWLEPANSALTTTTTSFYSHYILPVENSLFTWRYGNNGDIEVGLPGVPKKDLELKKEGGGLSVLVSGKIIFTFHVAPDVVAIRGKINEGLLTIHLEKKPKDECSVLLE